MSISKKEYSETSNRNKIDATHGKDEIEIETNEARRINDMDTFAPTDGEIGDEATDFDDLPTEVRRNHNFYDPTLSTGGREPDYEKTDGMHIAEAGEAGIAFGEDSYVDEEEE